MAEFPALPFFTDAWVADTKHLSRLERGTYHDLLVLMWRSPECRVPNDDVWLAKRLDMTVAEIGAELRPLISEFCQTDGNWLFQKRMRKEWEWCRQKRIKNTASAKSKQTKEKRHSERLAQKSDYAGQDHTAQASVKNTASDNPLENKGKRHSVRSAPHPTPPHPLREDSSMCGAQLSLDGGEGKKINADWPNDAWEQFYSLYPKKREPIIARKAFDKVQGSTSVPWEKFISAVKRYADHARQRGDPHFIKYPAGWLNAGRWDDEDDDEKTINTANRNGSAFNGGGNSSGRTRGKTRDDAILAGMGRIADRMARESNSGQCDDVLLDDRASSVNGGGAVNAGDSSGKH